MVLRGRTPAPRLKAPSNSKSGLLIVLVLIALTLGLIAGVTLLVRRSDQHIKQVLSSSPGDTKSAAVTIDLAHFGWQWCPDNEQRSVPANLAPTEGGKVRVATYRRFKVEWYWCRAQFKYSLAILYADVTSTVDSSIADVVLEFNYYDKDGAQIGSQTVSVRNLDPHGTAKIEERLPSQYAEWVNGTAWSMRLAKVSGG